MSLPPPLKVTYYLGVISSWCWWAELKNRYAGRADFSWKIALLDTSGLPVGREQCDWYYRRSRFMSRAIMIQ